MKQFFSILFLAATLSLQGQPSFLKQQLKYPHVAAAYREKWKNISVALHSKNIDSANYKVLIRIFKEEKQLEVWLKGKQNNTYILYDTYPVCRSSGALGPKRTEGDLQVPEGFYTINFFNAFSDYYLGMQLDYPNASDKILGRRPFGGQIMIHGNCVTIGCIPITDDKIKEVYLLCLLSKGAGNEVVVHSFPFKMNEKNMEQAEKNHNSMLTGFWNNLKKGYDYFETKKTAPKISVEANGNYKLN